MNMAKVMQVAWREFTATVFTKGFLFGLLIMPAMIALMAIVLPRVFNFKSPPVQGTIAVFDAGGQVVPGLTSGLSREAFLERRKEINKRMDAAMPDAVRTLSRTPETARKIDEALGEVPELSVERLSGAADLDAAMTRLKLGAKDPNALLMIIRVADDAIRPIDAGGKLGSYALYERESLDSRLTADIRSALRQAIIDARFADRDLDAAEIRPLMQVEAGSSEIVTKKGKQDKNEIARQLLPIAFMVLIMVSVMAGGQQLMTSTIEEKSSRVVEVLLAAVSPTELMAGKILGQMAVGAVMLAVYGGLMIVAVFAFSLMGMISFGVVFYLFVFFILSSVTIAALMAAIGAAVNEIREAQSLLTPVMLVIMLPMMFMGPIASDPNSTMATSFSLVPPVSPFVMMVRIGSATPPPDWQIWLAIGLNAIAAVLAVWVAGKVFRIGLLMTGKPPNLITLWRWIRMA